MLVFEKEHALARGDNYFTFEFSDAEYFFIRLADKHYLKALSRISI